MYVRHNKIKCANPKNYVVLVNDEKVPQHFWRISIVTGILPNRASERKGAIVRIKKANVILKCQLMSSVCGPGGSGRKDIRR